MRLHTACMRNEAQHTSDHRITPRDTLTCLVIIHTWGLYDRQVGNIRAGVTHEVTARSKSRRILELERTVS